MTLAVPAEAGPLLRLCPGRRISLRGQGLARSARAWELDSGWLVVTGMGRRNTRLAVDWMLGRTGPGRVITAGFGGGVNPDLAPGTVVVSVPDGFPGRAQILGTEGVRHGTIRTLDRVLVTAAEKRALWGDGQGRVDVVEMESEEVLMAAGCRGIPSAVVRVVSDAAGDTLPLDFNRLMTPDMELDPLRLAGALLASPGRIPDLLRFQRQVSGAAARLGGVLAGLLSASP